MYQLSTDSLMMCNTQPYNQSGLHKKRLSVLTSLGAGPKFPLILLGSLMHTRPAYRSAEWRLAGLGCPPWDSIFLHQVVSLPPSG